MIKTTILTTSMIAALAFMPHQAQAELNGDSFDVLGSVMDTTKKEISTKSTKDAIKGSKEAAEKFREKIISGWWEFMQANSKAKQGEFCTATFFRAKREKGQSGVDLFNDATVVSLFGPGGGYKGALLGFAPLSDEHKFPKLKSGEKVLVTLKQGNEAPSTLNAIYFEHVGKADLPMITFAVPTIEALMDSMEDKWSFEVSYKGKQIANIEWHSGLKARDELKKCLAGKPFDNKSHLKD